MSSAEAFIALTAVVVGFGAGVLSGMLGIGGAVVSTPAIRLLGASPIHAVGSTVPAILPGALSGAWRYHRAGLMDVRVGLVCGISGALFAVLGAVGASLLPEPRWLMVLTAVLMLWSGWAVARSGRDAPEHTGDELSTDEREAQAGDEQLATAEPTVRIGAPVSPRPTLGILMAVGALSGFVAGLLGVGGGIIMLPVFTGVLRLPVKRAIASSLLAVAIFSVPALVTHALAGNIDWFLAMGLVVGVVPGAQVGSRITVGASEARVRLTFGVFIAALALVYGASELIGLRG